MKAYDIVEDGWIIGCTFRKRKDWHLVVKEEVLDHYFQMLIRGGVLDKNVEVTIQECGKNNILKTFNFSYLWVKKALRRDVEVFVETNDGKFWN